MEITYIGHSGFLVELEDRCLLFDYYQGEIPPVAFSRPLYVFVSHRHQDHYNRAVLDHYIEAASYEELSGLCTADYAGAVAIHEKYNRK